MKLRIYEGITENDFTDEELKSVGLSKRDLKMITPKGLERMIQNTKERLEVWSLDKYTRRDLEAKMELLNKLKKYVDER